jgi:prepilin-type processing-associated H-X9-DG protein
LLISILIPTLSRARQSANTIQCASTLRQFGNANQMYISEFHGFCIPAYEEFDPNASPTVGGGARASNWWTANTAFRQYMNFTKWHYAAGDTVDSPLITDFTPSQSAGNTAAFNGYLPLGFVCPEAVRFLSTTVRTNWNQSYYPAQVIYGMNVEGISDQLSTATVTNPTPWAITRANKGPGVFGYKIAQVRRGSDKLFMVDAISSATACIVDESGSGINAATNYDKVHESTAAGVNKMTAWRHKDGANVAFFDGHVDWLRKDSIYSYDTSHNIVGNDRLWKVLQ